MLWDVLVSEPDPPRARGSGSETRDVRTREHVHYLNNDDVIALAKMAVRVFTWRTGLLLRSLMLRTSASKRRLTEARPEPEREDPSASDIASIAAKLVS